MSSSFYTRITLAAGLVLALSTPSFATTAASPAKPMDLNATLAERAKDYQDVSQKIQQEQTNLATLNQQANQLAGSIQQLQALGAVLPSPAPIAQASTPKK